MAASTGVIGSRSATTNRRRVYAGISTERHKIAAYVICSTLAGLGGLLFLLMYRNATPSSAGSLLELYAITGAVLGGCNLRGGEGTIPGIVLGAAVLPILQQICTYNSAIGSDLEYTGHRRHSAAGDHSK